MDPEDPWSLGFMGKNDTQAQEVKEHGDKVGGLTDAFDLHVQGEQIPAIKENPIKCLGKW